MIKLKKNKKWNLSKRIIPGGNMLISKRSEFILPEFWPAYYNKANDCYVWDLDKNKYLDMPTLFEQKQEEGRNVLKFPIHEYWLDIGRHDDFQKAQLDIYDLELI